MLITRLHQLFLTMATTNSRIEGLNPLLLTKLAMITINKFFIGTQFIVIKAVAINLVDCLIIIFRILISCEHQEILS